jgi:adenylylsulfate kinase
VARATAELLEARGELVRVLELDTILSRLIPDPKNTAGERDLVHRALGYMAARLTEAGIPVILDATAHRRRWREFARATIRRFAEVQLEGRPGAKVPDVDVPYEPALAPELVIDTTRFDVSRSAAAVASLAEQLASGSG